MLVAKMGRDCELGTHLFFFFHPQKYIENNCAHTQETNSVSACMDSLRTNHVNTI